MAIKLKRAYEAPQRTDGYRVLVDRLWPRGVTKVKARIDEWARDIAPTTALRHKFHGHPEKWNEFRREYGAFLRANADKVAPLAARALCGEVTLVYASKEPEHNNAVVLKDFIEVTARRLG